MFFNKILIILFFIKISINKQKLYEIPNRLTAIKEAIENLNTGEVLVVAGRGHENIQDYGKVKYFFSDKKNILKNIKIKNKNLSKFIDSKRNLFSRYFEEFSSFEELEIFTEPKDCKSNYWLQTLLLRTKSDDLKEAILYSTNKAGYMCRPVWKLLHRLAPYQNCPAQPSPVAESLEKRIINLPSSAGLI